MKNGLVLAWKLKQAIAITFWFHCITLLHSSKYKILNYPCAVESKIFFFRMRMSDSCPWQAAEFSEGSHEMFSECLY